MSEPGQGPPSVWQLWRQRLRTAGSLSHRFDHDERRLVLRSIIIGVVVWIPAYLLRIAVTWLLALNLDWLSTMPSVAFIFIPLLIGAAIVVALVRYKGTQVEYHTQDGRIGHLIDIEGDGLERAISLYHASDPSFEQALQGREGIEVRWDMPTFSLAARKFAATLVTLGSGGSGGLTASVTLIGESISAGLFKPAFYRPLANSSVPGVRKLVHWWAARDADNLQTAQLSGIAAAVSTITGAPFMSAFFAAEVMYRRRPLVDKLIYSLLASLVAYFLTNLVSDGHTTMFEVDQLFLPPTNWGYYGMISLMAIAISVVSIYFIRVRSMTDRFLHRRFPDLLTRHLVGAAVTGSIAVAVVYINGYFGLADSTDSLLLVVGPGTQAVDAALAGQLTAALAAVALAGRLSATVSTIGSGGSAGLLIPAISLGTMIAVILAAFTGLEPMTLIIPAITASLVSVVNVPLAGILLPIEMFSSHYILPSAIALLICTLLTQDAKIYRTQRETFDQREIVPGYAARRFQVPQQWAGHSLIDLHVRETYDVTVIGLLELSGEDGRPQVRLNIPPHHILEDGDALVVLGADEQLDRLEEAVAEMQMARGLEQSDEDRAGSAH